MEYLEAEKILKLHSGWSDEKEKEKDGIYLIASLRPFQGELVGEKEFQEIKDAIYAVYKKFNGNSQIDRDVVKYINSIIRGSYNFALRERAPLRRNKLITESQFNTLKKWTDEYTWMLHYLLLDLDPIKNMKDDI